MTNSLNFRSILGRRAMLSYKYERMISHYMSIRKNLSPRDYKTYIAIVKIFKVEKYTDKQRMNRSKRFSRFIFVPKTAKLALSIYF